MCTSKNFVIPGKCINVVPGRKLPLCLGTVLRFCTWAKRVYVYIGESCCYTCLTHFSPSLEKLVSSILAPDYSGNRPWETIC